MKQKQDYKILTGINIQWPWSELLVSGRKCIETRSYPLPKRLNGVELAIIETPGKRGKKEAGVNKARIIGTIIFTDSKLYESKESWLSDHDKHLVAPDDIEFKYRTNKPKYGWMVGRVKRLKETIPPPTKRGIIFAKSCKVPRV